MTSIELSIIDRATQLQRLSIEEQLSRLRFAETRAELDAHRRLAADLIRGLSLLAASSCGDKMPRAADLPATPTVGAVSNLPAVPVLDDADNAVSELGSPSGEVRESMNCDRPALRGPDKGCCAKSGTLAAAGNSINPNAGVKQAYPKGRWT